ncbi:MAG: histidine--tRNA ligase [Pseudomonadota bacterium]|nr:histidine--tRNA ligase [Pseudomonadota bacterium]
MKIQAIRGMQDLPPKKKRVYRFAEDVIRGVLESYCYKEIGVPVVESTDLFHRLVGEDTDIVEKEMYTFEDRNGDSLTLRPEGTAGVVRMGQERGLLFNKIQRFWYSGPMFRHERPQKGRYRQFEQIGVECFGMAGPEIDAELLFIAARIWQLLGISDGISLELNSIGTKACRLKYRDELVSFLKKYRNHLDEDSLRRLDSNPLRILDSKVSSTRALLKEAPVISNFLDKDSLKHLDSLKHFLDQRQIAYSINTSLVRGLDYYNRTVFEWVSSGLGSQGTICGGGRYDGLVEQIGGRATYGVGFAIGLDRVAMLLEDGFETSGDSDIFLASIGEFGKERALLLAEELRPVLKNTRVVVDCTDSKLKSQLKKANADGALVAVIIGEEEAVKGEVIVKHLGTGKQNSVNLSSVSDYLVKVLQEE